MKKMIWMLLVAMIGCSGPGFQESMPDNNDQVCTPGTYNPCTPIWQDYKICYARQQCGLDGIWEYCQEKLDPGEECIIPYNECITESQLGEKCCKDQYCNIVGTCGTNDVAESYTCH